MNRTLNYFQMMSLIILMTLINFKICIIKYTFHKIMIKMCLRSLNQESNSKKLKVYGQNIIINLKLYQVKHHIKIKHYSYKFVARMDI